jgi:ADP-heptose:LPS heptosyltransferase
MNYIKIFIVSSLLKLQNFILLFLQKIIWRYKPNKVKNILIYKVGNIGDIVTSYPAIRLMRLKYPNAKIDLLTSAGSSFKKWHSAASLLKSQKIVDKIIFYSDGNIFSLFPEIRYANYDLCFYMSDSRTHFMREVRKLIFFSLLKIRYVFGFSVSSIGFFRNSYAKKIPYPYINEVDRYLNVIQISKKNNEDLFTYNQNGSLKIQKKMEKINNSLTIATGAKWNKKKWDLDNFFQIAKLWLENRGDIIFVGNADDRIDAEKIINKINKYYAHSGSILNYRYYNFCNETTLEETIYLIEKSAVMIANDSGPAHLSSFTKTKVVTIQAPQDFKLKWDPYLSRDFVLRPQRKDVCNCAKNTCGLCINDITPNLAWEKINSILN